MSKRLQEIDSKLVESIRTIAKKKNWQPDDIARKMSTTIQAWKNFERGNGNSKMRAMARDLIEAYGGSSDDERSE